MSKSRDDPNMSKSSQSMSATISVFSKDGSASSVPTDTANKMSSKKKPKSSDNKAGDKSKSKSRIKQGKSKKSKKMSVDGVKSKKKGSAEKKSKKKSKKKSSGKNKKKLSKSGSKSRPANASLTAHEKKKICHKVRKIEASKGAVAVNSEKAIASAGYIVKEVSPYYTSDYSTVLSAESKKDPTAQLVVKVITLAECSPRARINLLQNSVRIMRFVGGGGGHHRKGSGSLSPIFPQVADIFLVGTVKLFVFMQYCPGRSVYDWVKMQRVKQVGEQANSEAAQKMIRNWFKAMVKGVHELQRIGVAHRAVKLQHILLDEKNLPKLIGWTKSVFFYEPNKRSILLQKKERRVRSNGSLPPEAFTGAYNPALADIWSLGVALVAMSTGSYPFNVRDKKTKFSSQWRRFIKTHMMNSYARNLCHRIFIISPKYRISTKALLSDKYFEVPAKKLTEVSCKLEDAAHLAIKEDSHVGGMSAIENVQGVKAVPMEAAPVTNGEEEPPPEEEKEAAEADAAGYDGGAVGEEEENLPPAEAQEECHLSQMNAPEEAEAEAMPEEGEEGVEEEAAGDEVDEGGGGGAEDGAEEE